jgi:catechol 2,3-dioxygenase-like lactoylglutathione lyase family enzyme
MSAVKAIPDEKQPMSPYLIVKDAAKAIEFYSKAFGARELYRLAEPSGRIGHAELRIGGSKFMLADEYPDAGALSPATIGGSRLLARDHHAASEVRGHRWLDVPGVVTTVRAADRGGRELGRVHIIEAP